MVVNKNVKEKKKGERKKSISEKIRIRNKKK